MILTDQEIIKEVDKSGMISPFYVGEEYEEYVKGKDISIARRDEVTSISKYLTSCGYDVTLANEYRVFKSGSDFNTKRFFALKPEKFDQSVLEEKFNGFECEVPPHGFVLARTAEYFKIPRDVFAVCYGKSTYSRCGLNIIVGAIEPGFEGSVVLEISNLTDFPIRIYSGYGIAQFVFHRLNNNCILDYGKKKGKYQEQKEIDI